MAGKAREQEQWFILVNQRMNNKAIRLGPSTHPCVKVTESYLQECDKMCIPSIPAIVNVLKKKPEVLDFTKMYIGDKQAIALAAAFKVYHPKQVLLSFNGLMNFGTTAVLSALEGSNVQVIDLSRNDFAPSVVPVICKTIAQTPSLTEVKVVQCCHLKPEHVKRIQDAYAKRQQ